MLVASLNQLTHSAIKKANRLADLIEFRIDLTPDIKKWRALCHRPVIFTFKQSHPTYYLELKPDYIDLPHTADPALFKKLRKRARVICSLHDYEGTPPHLTALLTEMQKCPADLYKLATYAQSTLDAVRMLELVQQERVIGLCMGPLGTITRIIGSKCGAPWAYGAVEEGQETAPGQLSLNTLLGKYRYRSITERTELYGLIGDPVWQSRSDVVHNVAFHLLDLDALYLKMCVKRDEVETFFKKAPSLGFKGLSITMPLKEKVGEMLGVEALNTIAFRKSVEGWNTDGEGALNALEKVVCVRGKTVFVVGAGGTARAILYEAHRRGAHVHVFNRTVTRDLGVPIHPLTSFAHCGHYDILINATSVGMNSMVMPISEHALLPNRVVMDVIAHPRKTALLQAAEKKGCAIVSGEKMWTQQAVGQYCHWFSGKLSPR